MRTITTLLVVACICNTDSLVLAQQADFFWSVFDLNQGAENAPINLEYDQGDIGSLYLYYSTNGPTDSELAVGFFLDIDSSHPGVIRFTRAETFDFDITVAGTPIGRRLASRHLSGGGISGQTGYVTDNLIEGLAAFTITGGPGILENTGGVFFDQGFDSCSLSFQVGRIDFEIIGRPGQVTNIRTGSGRGLIVNSPDCHEGRALLPKFSCATVRVGGASFRQQKPVDCEIRSAPTGDLNNDGITDLLDVTQFVDLIIAGQYDYQADLNRDGMVDLRDVDKFIQLIVGDPGPGDFNCDKRINLLDVGCLLDLLIEGRGYDNCTKLDVNGDGVIDLSDVQPMIDLLLEIN